MTNQVISFLQSKGGAGKSTTLATIATHMANDGAKIAIIDTDPNKDTLSFCELSNFNFEYGFVDNPNNIKPAISQLKETGYDVIFIDTAGADSTLNTYVIANSDLVIIPSKCNKSDAEKAVYTYKRVMAVADNFNKTIPVKLVLVDVDHGTNMTESIRKGLNDANMPLLNVNVGHATGFKELASKAIVPKSGPTRKHINSLMCELQMKQLLEFYNKPFKKVGEGS